MKKLIFLLSIVVFVSCSKENKPTDPENGNSSLTVIDFNPKQTYSFEEVVIEVEELDESATIEVLFNGVASNRVEIQENTIRARVPQQATTGEITLKYNTEDISVGTLEITQEMDKIYAQDDLNYLSKIYKLNSSNGSFGEVFYDVPGYDLVGFLSFSKESNTILTAYSVQCGQTGGCYTDFTIDNMNGQSITYHIRTDDPIVSGFEERFIHSLVNDKFYFIYYFRFPGTVTHYLAEIDLNTMQRTILRDFVVSGESFLANGSIFLENTSELVGFDNQNDLFIILNLNDYSNTIFEYPNTSLTDLNLTLSGDIFGTYNANIIAKVNPENGSIIEEVFTANRNIRDLSYSESTGRFFWFEYTETGADNSTELHIYNPVNQIETWIQTEEIIDALFTDY